MINEHVLRSHIKVFWVTSKVKSILSRSAECRIHSLTKTHTNCCVVLQKLITTFLSLPTIWKGMVISWIHALSSARTDQTGMCTGLPQENGRYLTVILCSAKVVSVQIHAMLFCHPWTVARHNCRCFVITCDNVCVWYNTGIQYSFPYWTSFAT